MTDPSSAPVVDLVEVGPRDGLQNEARTLSVETRTALVERLVEGGVRRLEAVSFVRGDRVPQMADAEAVLAGLTPRDDVALIGLVLNRRGAERAAETICDELNIVLPVTDDFATRNQGVTVEQGLEHAAAAVEVARQAGKRASVTLAVAFGCPFQGQVPVAQVARVVERVADLGIDELAFADTIGVGVPSQVHALAELVRGDARVPGLRFHFHNTRNTGYANAWAATTLDLSGHGGRVSLDASVGGFGGCPFAPAATGNIATEDLLHLLRRSGVPVEGADVDALGSLVDTASWLSGELDSPVQALLGRAGDLLGGAAS
ncbi:hydroxymethylglutaryl-CoA lyase [Nocardioides scoriae]|uniref:Hydroxymethylglutaryl-CoA lyase n=1 Tax=Nocardioides scoriae TaxID=642780 RepID=A0A1H1PC93_9ACTN|nr:hydroxymethylglutaryl-CoA lyase [Nocardioides scoriae]SDS08710.1 hydroxymethylglutaryl-CoA lyase [Nocardioides scoriae]